MNKYSHFELFSKKSIVPLDKPKRISYGITRYYLLQYSETEHGEYFFDTDQHSDNGSPAGKCPVHYQYYTLDDYSS